MTEERIEVVLADLEKELPPVVYRNWEDWRRYIPYSPRYVANLDSLGTGPDERLMVGGVTGYPRESMMRFLKDRVKLIQGRNVIQGK